MLMSLVQERTPREGWTVFLHEQSTSVLCFSWALCFSELAEPFLAKSTLLCEEAALRKAGDAVGTD